MEIFGIIGAMEMEVEILKKEMKIDEVIRKGSMNFYKGTLDNTNVVVVQSGVGKVNAALCVQILVDIFQVSSIINTGVAGSLDPTLNIGDIVISKDAIHHDVNACIFDYALGEVPGIGTLAFQADENLISLTEKCCKEVIPDTGVKIGRVLSGDQFICDGETKKKLVENFQGTCVEMEGASIAQSAYLNQVPFVIIRAISDKADESVEEEYPIFERKAALHCSKLVHALIGRL